MEKKRPIVLVVDDEPFVGRVIRLVLEEQGLAEVVVVGSGAEMWEALAQVEPDLILLDILLPDAHGAALLSQLREDEEHRDVPVIILTGVVGVEGSTVGFDMAEGILAKPLAPRALQEAVLRHTRQRVGPTSVPTEARQAYG